ncbi:hypothetical protein CH063_15511 [Colletotrichum higginsianum]|uniref:Uncharacterized protein n=1 Tax=Colletotrichum higginsianum (strain IMI 349063) TaxID=759273 RepID=H1W365_COLHI|nr:hypothetical protein CH063_15511 [Colletotrichum higginsianum]
MTTASYKEPLAKYSSLEQTTEDLDFDAEFHLDGFSREKRQDCDCDKRTRQHLRIAWIQGVLLVVLAGYTLFLWFQLRHERNIHLGADPSGFVPREVGQPLHWAKYNEESDPHHFNSSVFDTLENIHAAARVIKTMHASNVRTNGRRATYMDLNDEVQPLPVYVTEKGTEMYTIRAFHQMHCIVSTM